MPYKAVKLCGQVNTVSWFLTRLTWLGEKGGGKKTKNILGYPFCFEGVKHVKVHRSVLKNRREGSGAPHSKTVLKLDWAQKGNASNRSNRYSTRSKTINSGKYGKGTCTGTVTSVTSVTETSEKQREVEG